MSRETGNVFPYFLAVRRFIGQKRRKRNYEQHTCITDTVSGGTGTDGDHYFRYGIYPAGIFPDTWIIHYVSDGTGSSWGDDSRTFGRCDLRTGIRQVIQDSQPVFMPDNQMSSKSARQLILNGRFRNHVIQHQPTGNSSSMYHSTTPGRLDHRTDF